jgi:hypothetical protein
VKSDPAILTIAIPTYGRATTLQAQLERLVPQLTPEVRLCVYDNASPDNTQEVVAKFLPQGVTCFRAMTNCGGGRNIFRCFEECSTDWLWVLCDDDLATTSAVADLLAVLRHESASFIHTCSWISPYSRNAMVTDLPTFFQQSNLSSLWWVTSGIYQMNSFRPLLRLYAEAMSTWGPHLVMVLSLLESRSGKVLLTPVRLTIPTTTPIAWSTSDFLLRSSLVPEFLACPNLQRLIAERIFIEFFNDFMLMSLRETVGNQQIRKWQRICGQVRRNLKAYQARGVGSYVIRHWYRAGSRKRSLRMALQSIQIKLLSWCPVRFFHVLAGFLPLPKNIRDDYYGKRNTHVPYI